MAYCLQKLERYCRFKSLPFSSYMFHTTVSKTRGTAGIIVIGDEILKGQVQDTNSHFIARHLFDLGIKVKKVCVVADVEDEIAHEVKEFSENFLYVITTGGIGPTHDDVTFSAVAKAFGEKLVLHPTLQKLCTEFFKVENVTSPAMKLAHVPESAKLTFGFDKVKGRTTLYPNVSVHNVYIFPGIPNLMERLFLAVYKEQFSEGSSSIFSEDLYLNLSEVEIADELNTVVDKYPDVSIGSYPQLFNRYYQVHLTIQSSNEEESKKAYEDLKSILPGGSIVEFDPKPTFNSYVKLINFADKEEKHFIKHSMEIIRDHCEEYRPCEMCVLFNGDPESTVALHLVHSFMRRGSENVPLNVVSLIKEDHLELQQFILDTQKRYRVNITRLSEAQDDVLQTFIDYHKQYKLVFIGSTEGSSTKVVDLMKRAQKNYPALRFVNPINMWTCAELWDFIHSLYLPFSILYK